MTTFSVLLLATMPFASLHAASGGSTEDAPKPPGTEDIYRALSARDGTPPCNTIEALSPEPVAALLYIVDHATQPPWASVRAATCLVQGHASDIQPSLEKWVSHSETRGLGLVTLNLLDQIPTTIAIPVARAALNGPLASDARTRILNAQNAELRSLAE